MARSWVFDGRSEQGRATSLIRADSSRHIGARGFWTSNDGRGRRRRWDSILFFAPPVLWGIRDCAAGGDTSGVGSEIVDGGQGLPAADAARSREVRIVGSWGRKRGCGCSYIGLG